MPAAMSCNPQLTTCWLRDDRVSVFMVDWMLEKHGGYGPRHGGDGGNGFHKRRNGETGTNGRKRKWGTCSCRRSERGCRPPAAARAGEKDKAQAARVSFRGLCFA